MVGGVVAIALKKVKDKLVEIKEHPELLKEGAEALRKELKENGFGQVIKVREILQRFCP